MRLGFDDSHSSTSTKNLSHRPLNFTFQTGEVGSGKRSGMTGMSRRPQTEESGKKFI